LLWITFREHVYQRCSNGLVAEGQYAFDYAPGGGCHELVFLVAGSIVINVFVFGAHQNTFRYQLVQHCDDSEEFYLVLFNDFVVDFPRRSGAAQLPYSPQHTRLEISKKHRQSAFGKAESIRRRRSLLLCDRRFSR